MREIKFKSVFEEYGNSKLSVTTDTWGVIEGGFSSPSSRSRAKRINELQYTGLKDKNGKEIYEGDIVSEKNMKTIEKATVSYYKDRFVLDFGKLGKYLISDRIPFYEVEVIGNIFENPEILTK